MDSICTTKMCTAGTNAVTRARAFAPRSFVSGSVAPSFVQDNSFSPAPMFGTTIPTGTWARKDHAAAYVLTHDPRPLYSSP